MNSPTRRPYTAAAACRFGGCENPGQDAEYDDKGQSQTGQGAFGGFEHLTRREASGGQVSFSAFPGMSIGYEHQTHPDHHTGHDPGQEQAGHRCVGHITDQNHEDAGRNDGSDGAGSGLQGCGKSHVIAFFLHGRQQNRAHGCCICSGRS